MSGCSERDPRPACETQLDPSVIPGAAWEQRGEQQREAWPEGVVRSIQPWGALGGEKGQDEGRAAGPSARMGAEVARVGVWAVFGSLDVSGRGAGWLMLW